MSVDPTDTGSVMWPTSPTGYEWKGTLKQRGDTWLCLAHCTSLSDDCVINVRRVEDPLEAELGDFIGSAKQLIAMGCEQLIAPVCVFQHREEVWVVYPRVNGGAIGELLRSHYHGGFEDESIVARIVREALAGVHYLHNHQVVHRNIRADSLHLNKENGSVLLWEFGELKEIKYKDAMKRPNTIVPAARVAWTDPLIVMERHASWFKGDIYSVGVTALELTFGAPPECKPLLFTPESVVKLADGLSPATAYAGIGNPFGDDFVDFVHQCTVAPSKRQTAAELLKHKFLKKACSAEHMATTLALVCKSTESRISSKLSAPSSFPNVSSHMTSSRLLSSSDTTMSSDWDFSLGISTPKSSDFKTSDLSTAKSEESGTITSSSTALSRLTAEETAATDASAISDALPALAKTAKAKGMTISMRKTALESSTSDSLPLQTRTTHSSSSGMDMSPPPPQSDSKVQATIEEHSPFSETDDRAQMSDSDSNCEERELVTTKSTKIGRFAVEESTPMLTTKSLSSSEVERGGRLLSMDTLDGRSSFSYSEEQRAAGGVLTPVLEGDRRRPHVVLPPIHSRQQSDSHSISITTPAAGVVGRFEVSRMVHITESPSQSQADTELSVSSVLSDEAEDGTELNSPAPHTVGRFFIEKIKPGELELDIRSHTSAAAATTTAAARTKPSDWSTQECVQWLGSLGGAYKEYSHAFEENGVDGAMLEQLDQHQLEEVGVCKVIHRTKILQSRDKLWDSFKK